MGEFEEIIEEQCHGNGIFQEDEWSDRSSENEEEDDDREPVQAETVVARIFALKDLIPALNNIRSPTFFQISAALQRWLAPNLHCFDCKYSVNWHTLVYLCQRGR